MEKIKGGKEKSFNMKNLLKNTWSQGKNKSTNQKEHGITLIALVITIIVLLILAGVTISILTGDNGLLAKAEEAREKTEEASRLEELQLITLNQAEKLTLPVATLDFVQPYLFNEYSKADINDYVKTLKRAGYEEIILQNTMIISGGKNSDIKIEAAWYDSNLITNSSSLELYRPEVLKTLVDAIENNGMKIYIGLALSDDWWSNNFENEEWRTKNAEFFNKMIEEIRGKFVDYDCIEGFYWSYEIYPNDKEYEIYWSEMINNNRNYLKTLDEKYAFMMSPFISTVYDLSYAEVNEQWKKILDKVNLQSGDIICMQDCLATSTLNASEVLEYLTAVRTAVKQDNRNLEFWLNVENYVETRDTLQPASLERYKVQLEICSRYAEKLASFSYSHYYHPNVTDKYDKEYRKYYASVTNEERHKIEVPENGTVYEDINGMEVPVPRGFKVSDDENIVKEGLVIKDEKGNEYVWIPVNGGVASKGYQYADDEYKTVYYTRYLNNGIDIGTSKNDTLPTGVNSDTDQIEKYAGFYVGRYESSFEYNNGNPTVQIKNTQNSQAVDTFSWQYADSDIYTGYLWNNINYQDAKNMAENMAIKNKYDKTVKTGMINGTQWDTMLKWIHSNDSTYNMIYNGTTWGNYVDAQEPATNDNYEKGKLQPSGSNKNWKVLNLYDIAGNLSEWTSELIGENAVLRSNGYNDNGVYGSPSYGVASGSYQFPNVGFRVVLYIQ